MTSTLTIGLALVLLLLAGAVHPASAEWTVAAFLGAARTKDSSIRLIRPFESTDVTMSPVVYRSESFDTPIYYGYRVGFFPRSRWFGIEGELIHLKVIADTSRETVVEGTLRGEAVSTTRPLAAIVQRFSITHGVNLALVNAVARLPFRRREPHPRWFFSGRLGAGASVPHPESTIAGTSLEQYEWGAFSVQAAAGVEVRLGRRVSLAGEYKLTRTDQDVSVAHGSVRTRLTTHHLVTGVVAHLGAFR